MPTFQWVQDIPAGILRNNALSDMLVEASIQNTQFVQFSVPADDSYGRNRGDTVSWPRTSNMAEQTSLVLSESERIPEYSYQVSTRSMTVQEIGATVPVTNLALQLTTFNLMQTTQRRLRDNLALGLDTMASVAFKNTQYKYAITGLASANLATNGVFGATATANLNVYHVTRICDILGDTVYAQSYDDGMFVCIARTLGIRGIMDDPDWKEWTNYKDPNMRYFAERGSLDRATFVETNHANALGRVGTGAVCGEAVFFGFDAVRIAEAMAPELRVGIPQDLGRQHIAGFYGILSFQSTWGDRSNAGEVNILHVGSL